MEILNKLSKNMSCICFRSKWALRMQDERLQCLDNTRTREKRLDNNEASSSLILTMKHNLGSFQGQGNLGVYNWTLKL